MPYERFDAAVPETHRPYVAAADRYQHFGYSRVGESGLLLSPISLGFWWNFGDNRPFATQREIVRYAFDHGVTHFDLANNYGPPYGAAEENFGRIVDKDLRPYRHELTISTKAGWDMWPGPAGQLGTRQYMLASLDESLERMHLDYVDIFYSHRPDPHTPIAETISALDRAYRSGKTRYVGISSYSAEATREAARIAAELGTPLVIHQPSYSLMNRWIEPELQQTLIETGMGAIAFTALGQGLLTDKYLDADAASVARAGARTSFNAGKVTPEVVRRLHGLDDIAQERGQTLSQLALAWVLHNPAVASTLIGVSSVAQLKQNLAALDNLEFSDDELARIDAFAVDSGIDLWRSVSTL